MATIEHYRTLLAEAEAEESKLAEALFEAQTVVRFCRRRIEAIESQPTLPGIVDQSFAGMKLPEAMRALMSQVRRPMHVKEIANLLVSGGFQASDFNMLVISIPTAAKRRDDLFTKIGPNTFVLRREASGTETTAASA